MRYAVIFLIVCLQLANAQQNECKVDYYQTEIADSLKHKVEQLFENLSNQSPELRQVWLDNQEYLFDMQFVNFSISDEINFQVTIDLDHLYGPSLDDTELSSYEKIFLGVLNPHDERFQITAPVHFKISKAEKINIDKSTEYCRFYFGLIVADEDEDDLSLSFYHYSYDADTGEESEITPLTNDLLPELKHTADAQGLFLQFPYKKAEQKTVLTQVILRTEENVDFCPNRNNGQPCLMNFPTAKEYCDSFHWGLPSIQDLARAFYADGVNRSNKDKHAIYNEEGTVDFYYQAKGYTIPVSLSHFVESHSESLYQKVWSASSLSDGGRKNYVFNIQSGQIENSNYSNPMPVVCIEEKNIVFIEDK